MEPVDVNQSPDEPRLEAWLRQQAAVEPLPDAGFSRRVLHALPPRRTSLAWRRWAVAAVGAALGAIATRLDLGEWPRLANVFEPFREMSGRALSVVSNPTTVAAVLGAAMVVVGIASIVLVLQDAEPGQNRRSAPPANL